MSVAVETDHLNKILVKLKAEKDLGSFVKSDLYSHLTEVFSRIMQYHPYDAFEKFEEISILVKHTNYTAPNPASDYELNGRIATGYAEVTNNQAIRAIEKAKSLLSEKVFGVEMVDRQLLTTGKKFNIPNLEKQACMLEWAGVSFGDDRMYILQKSLKRLASLSGATSLKLFGKIFGTKQDYWIVSGVLPYSEETARAGCEKRGEGVNSQVYWVTDNFLGDWIQLPDAQPEQLAVARMIKYCFTGDLNACINSCPPFPGKERHLLRAQLARIAHATELCPKGSFEIDEETQAVNPAAEPPAMDCDSLKSLEAWSHLHPMIKRSGRCKNPAAAGEEGGEGGEEDPADAAEAFRALNEDAPIIEGVEAWISRVAGDLQPYKAKDGDAQASYATNVLRSLRWPGAVTVAKGGAYCSIYLGDGQKRGDTSFNPTEPPEVQSDPVGQGEMPEPTPLTAPEDPPEEDTDAENKPDGEEDEEDA